MIFKTLAKNLMFLSILATSSCEQTFDKSFSVATNVWPGYEMLYLARSNGAFDNQNIRLVELPSATEVAHAFSNRTIDMAMLTLDEALAIAQYHPDVRIVMIADFSSGADVVLGHAHVKQLSDLKDRKIAVENTAVGAVMLISVLSASDLTLSDIKIVPVTLEEHIDAYTSYQADAIITFEPFKSHLIKQGASVLFDSREIPGLIVDVLITRTTTLENHPDKVKAVIKAHFDALNYFHKSPHDAAIKMADRLSVIPEEVTDLYQGLSMISVEKNRHFLNKQSAKFLGQSSQELLQILMDNQLLIQQPDLDSLFDHRFLPEI